MFPVKQSEITMPITNKNINNTLSIFHLPVHTQDESFRQKMSEQTSYDLGRRKILTNAHQRFFIEFDIVLQASSHKVVIIRPINPFLF